MQCRNFGIFLIKILANFVYLAFQAAPLSKYQLFRTIPQSSDLKNRLCPSPELLALCLQVCVEVRTVIENCLHTLSVQWFPHLTSISCVKCPCLASKACSSHKRKNCRDQNCIHFLGLNEYLSTATVWCEYFKVDTSFIRRYFPAGIVNKYIHFMS